MATNSGNPSRTGAGIQSVQKVFRTKIAEVATDYIGALDWVPYWVLTYQGSRSPSVAAVDFDTCNVFVGDVLQMTGTVVANKLKGATYNPSPYTLSTATNQLPPPWVENPLSAPEQWHVGTLSSGWVYIGTTEWANPFWYQDAPKSNQSSQGLVAGQAGGGAACWNQAPGDAFAAQPGDVIAEDTIRGGKRVHHVGIVTGAAQTVSASSRNVTYDETITRSDWGFRSSDPDNQGLKSDSRVKRYQCY